MGESMDNSNLASHADAPHAPAGKDTEKGFGGEVKKEERRVS